MQYIRLCEESEQMESTNGIKLGIFLNYCVFLYEICGEVEDARVLSKRVFDSALHDLDRLQEDEMMRIIPIMQCLLDNYKLWESEELTESQKIQIKAEEEKKRIDEIRK